MDVLQFGKHQHQLWTVTVAEPKVTVELCSKSVSSLLTTLAFIQQITNTCLGQCEGNTS